jgi:hypothetical protein
MRGDAAPCHDPRVDTIDTSECRCDAGLLPHFEAMIVASQSAPEVAAARGYRNVTKQADRKALGFAASQRRVPVVLIPVHDVNGIVALHQIRTDAPRVGRETGP